MGLAVVLLSLLCFVTTLFRVAAISPTFFQYDDRQTICSGKAHTCAVLNNGAVLCWGDNSFGQATPPVTAVPYLAVGCGPDFSCGVMTDGNIKCWGEDTYGQVDPPSFSSGYSTPNGGSNIFAEPIVGGFRAVNCGQQSCCGVDTGANLHCWGTVVLGGLVHDIKTMSMGYSDMCVVTKSTSELQCGAGPSVVGFQAALYEAVYCSAYACFGVFANGTGYVVSPGNQWLGTFPSSEYEGLKWLSFSVNGPAACGLLANQTIRCWCAVIQNPEGGTGVDSDPCDQWRSNPMFFPPEELFVNVATGGGHVCALNAAGEFVCWGSNTNGQRDPPHQPSILQVALGVQHDCVLLDDETMTCFGSQSAGFGELTIPTDGQNAPLSWKSIAAGRDYSCGVLFNSSLLCWGTLVNPPPMNVAGDWGSGSGGWSVVVAQYTHGCGLLLNDTIVCFGDLRYQDIPSVSSLLVFREIAVGFQSTCALTAQSELMCWGFITNMAGNRPYPVPTSGRFFGLAAGSGTFCALPVDNDDGGGGGGGSTGTAAIPVCWGDNSYNQISGLPTTPVLQVGAGLTHTCVQNLDFTISCFGDDLFGQADSAAGSSQATLFVGDQHNCVLHWGSLRCWGQILWTVPDYGYRLQGLTSPLQHVYLSSPTTSALSAMDAHFCGDVDFTPCATLPYAVSVFPLADVFHLDAGTYPTAYPVSIFPPVPHQPWLIGADASSVATTLVCTVSPCVSVRVNNVQIFNVAFVAGPGVSTGLLINSDNVTLWNVSFTNFVGTDGGAALTTMQAGVTLWACSFTKNVNKFDGGAAVVSYSRVWMTETAFNGNVGSSGGAVLNFASVIYMTACSFVGNFGQNGGGIAIVSGEVELYDVKGLNNTAIYYGGFIYFRGNASIEASHFEHNRALAGGVIYLIDGSLDLVTTALHHNEAFDQGGAVMMTGQARAQFVYDSFLDNHISPLTSEWLAILNVTSAQTYQTDGSGGAVACVADYVIVPEIVARHSVFLGNYALNKGGAFEMSGCKLSLDRCTVEYNRAALFGGGVYSYGSTVVMVNTSLSSNNATSRGGAMYLLGCVGARLIQDQISYNFANWGAAIFEDTPIPNLVKESTHCHANMNGADWTHDNCGQPKGTASVFNFTQVPIGGQSSGHPFVPPFVITLLDSFGNVVLDDMGTYLSIGLYAPDVPSGSNPLMFGPTVVQVYDGQADFSGLGLVAAPGNYVLYAYAEVAVPQGDPRLIEVTFPIQIVPCHSGQEYDPPSQLCRDCPLGSFQVVNNSCKACPKGSFGNRVSLKCDPCPEGLYSTFEGVNECSSCELGKYTLLTGTVSCVECPSAAACSGSQINSIPNYWVYFGPRNDVRTYPCPDNYCLGNNRCVSGRLQSATNYLCGQCQPEYTEWDNACVPCTTVNGGYVLLILLVSWGFVIFTYFLSRSSTGFIKVFMYFTATALLTAGPSKWLSWIRVLDFSPHAAAGAACVAPLDPWHKFGLGFFAPLLCLLELGLTMLIHYVHFRVSLRRGWIVLAPRSSFVAGGGWDPNRKQPLLLENEDDADEVAALGGGVPNKRGYIAPSSVDPEASYLGVSADDKEKSQLAAVAVTPKSHALVPPHTPSMSSVSVVGGTSKKLTTLPEVSVAARRSQTIVVPSKNSMSARPPEVSQGFPWSQYQRTLIALVLFSYTTVSSSTIRYLQCFPIGDEGQTSYARVIWSAPALSCDGSTYKAWFATVMVVLVLYVFGLPFGLMVFLCHNKRRFTERSSSKIRGWAILFEMYGKHAVWWESYAISRRILYVILDVVLFQSQSKFMSFALANTGFLLIHTFMRPFVTVADNAAESVSLFLLSMLCVILSPYPIPYPDGLQVIVAMLVLVPILAGVLWFIMLRIPIEYYEYVLKCIPSSVLRLVLLTKRRDAPLGPAEEQLLRNIDDAVQMTSHPIPTSVGFQDSEPTEKAGDAGFDDRPQGTYNPPTVAPARIVAPRSPTHSSHKHTRRKGKHKEVSRIKRAASPLLAPENSQNRSSLSVNMQFFASSQSETVGVLGGAASNQRQSLDEDPDSDNEDGKNAQSQKGGAPALKAADTEVPLHDGRGGDSDDRASVSPAAALPAAFSL